MKKLSRAKGLIVFFVMAAQLCLPAFHRSAAAMLNPAFEGYRPPPPKSLLAPISAPFVFQGVDKNTSPESLSWEQDNIQKLGKVMQKLSCVNLKSAKPKCPNKSVGQCAGYVVRGLGKVGIRIERGHAKNLPPNLEKAGFKKMDLCGYEPRPGDVAVIKPWGKHRYGHASVFCPDGHWYSDFKQRCKGLFGAWAYKGKPKNNLLSFYRHETFFGIDKSLISENLISENTEIREVASSRYFSVNPSLAPDISAALTATAYAQNNNKASPETHVVPNNHEAATSLTTDPKALTKQREDLELSNVPSGAELLRIHWNEARKAVLQRNAALREGNPDAAAKETLQDSVKNMQGLLHAVMQSDPKKAFKAARYVVNKYDDKDLFSDKRSVEDKKIILALIKENMDEITKRDKRLGEQAAKFVFNKAGKGELRESVRGLLPAKKHRSLCV